MHTDVSFLEACMILLHGVRNVSVLEARRIQLHGTHDVRELLGLHETVWYL